jgi:hypothetical protein
MYMSVYVRLKIEKLKKIVYFKVVNYNNIHNNEKNSNPSPFTMTLNKKEFLRYEHFSETQTSFS